MRPSGELSHNLRTPLTTIRLIIEVLARKEETLSAQTRSDFLRTALEQTKKLELAIVEAESHVAESTIDEELNAIVLDEERVEPEIVHIRGSELRSAPCR